MSNNKNDTRLITLDALRAAARALLLPEDTRRQKRAHAPVYVTIDSKQRRRTTTRH